MNKKSSSIKSPKGFKITSPAMNEVHAEIHDYAFHGRPCILFGPSGAGKEFVARYYFQVFKEHAINKAPFFSLNCAGLTYELAISELFGHVKGSFTGAINDKQGLFKKAANGVLFLDEIGDLPTEIQAMLLRAVDPETHEARQLGANKNYQIKNVIVVCATDQPKKRLRPALLARLGKQVHVPGVDKRSEDIGVAVEYFARLSLLKRRDHKEVISSVFQKQAGKKIETPTNAEPETYLAQRIALRLTPLVRERSWPGNFREIRNAIDTAVIRAEKKGGIEKFINRVVFYYNYHQRNLSHLQIETESGIPFEEGRINENILRKIYSVFPRIAKAEKLKWAIYLSDENHSIFYRNDLDDLFPALKKRTIQDRLKKLVESGLIKRKGDRGDEYHINSILATKKIYEMTNPLGLPELGFVTAARENEIKHVRDLIKKSRGVFISGERKTGKTTFVFSLGAQLMKSQTVFYHALEDARLAELFCIIIEKLKAHGIHNVPEFDHDHANDLPVFAATLSGFLENLFPPDSEPVLILDNTNILKSSGEIKALNIMLQNWKMFSFILIGNKLGNDLHLGNGISLTEYKIKPIS